MKEIFSPLSKPILIRPPALSAPVDNSLKQQPVYTGCTYQCIYVHQTYIVTWQYLLSPSGQPVNIHFIVLLLTAQTFTNGLPNEVCSHWMLSGQISHLNHSLVGQARGQRLPRELPDMMSTNFLDLLTPSPLSAFGSDLYYKIHATSLTTSASP